MLSVVIPTYKEAGNLPQLIASIDDTMKGADVEYEVLIVDDMSPDDTAVVAERLADSYPVRLLRAAGRPRDLSLSVVDGIAAASSNRIAVMDADLSHPPGKLIEMAKTLDLNPDSFVIGSRYAEGGSFDRDWSWWRFLNSHVATLLARPLVRCSDPMSGFFMFDRDRLDQDKLRPIGYKIGLEVMVRGSFSDIVDVPISFADRKIGDSKMNLAQQFKYLRHLRRLYLHRFGGLAEFVHFGAVGASGFVIDVIFYYLFQVIGLNHLISRALSFCPAATWNWAINRRATFGDRRRRARAKQWLEFLATSSLGFSINMGTYYYVTTNLAFFEKYKFAGLIVGIATASLFNFTLSTLFVYSDKRA